MEKAIVRKIPLRAPSDDDDLQHKSPQERIGMMWQLALDAWSFKEKLDVEPRMQRQIVVILKRPQR